jgi:hypothetical protein
MSVTYTAIGASTVITGYMGQKGAKDSASALEEGSANAAAATIQATEMQIAELGRQFDQTTAILMPQIQAQYNAAGAYGDLMGYTAATPNGAQAGSGATAPDGSSLNVQPDGSVMPGGQGAISGGTSNVAAAGGGSMQVGGPEWARFQEQVLGDQIAIAINAGFSPQKAIAEGARRAEGFFTQMKKDGDLPADFTVPSSATLVEAGGTLYQQNDGNFNSYGRNEDGSPTQGTGPDSYANVQRQFEAAGGTEGLADTTPAGPTYGRTNEGQQVGGRDENGAFIDPNTDQTKQADNVAANPLAGPIEDDLMINRTNDVRLATENADDDQYIQNIRDNQLATDEFTDDDFFNFTQDTAITTADFQESPGYDWTREEMQREQDRKNSAGGNYGGRAMMEATRRAGGIANTEYYNWADLRAGDLARQDSAVGDWQGRTVIDAGREDNAYENWINRGSADVQRGDLAYADYQSRTNQDVGRMDQANYYDQGRQDHNYYNYLDNLGRAAGFGNAVGQFAGASQSFGGATAGVYGNQGSQLSGNYSNLGNNLAGVEYQSASDMNSALQGGMSNYLFANYMKNNPNPTPTPTPTPNGGGGGAPATPYNGPG